MVLFPLLAFSDHFGFIEITHGSEMITSTAFEWLPNVHEHILSRLDVLALNSKELSDADMRLLIDCSNWKFKTIRRKWPLHI